MTLAPPDSRVIRPPAAPRVGIGSGWLPAGVVFLGAIVVFLWCGVSARDLAVFAAYVGGGVALPGTLLWRALTGSGGPKGRGGRSQGEGRSTAGAGARAGAGATTGAGTIAGGRSIAGGGAAARGGRFLGEDVAAGLALGYAVEVLAYIPARAVGMPLLVLVPPVVVLVTFAIVPGLRRHWRGAAGKERMPAWSAWALAGVVAYLIGWSTMFLYRLPVTTAYVDMPYHLALVGEVRNHVPPTLPSVLGERLSYHWFVYAEMAATSWVTGIEPVTLVYRLATLPMTAATVVLVAVLGRRLGGRWGAGVAAVGVTYFLFGPVLEEGVVFTTRSMFTAWASPTQTFGALLFVPVVLLLVRGRGRVAMVLLLVALTGAKATYLPLLLAGLLLVAVLRRGRWLWAAGVTLGCLLFAQFVVFGQGAQGTAVSPFATMRALWGTVAEIDRPELAGAPVVPLVVLTAVHLFCLACVWGGVAGLGWRALEPPMLLLLGIGAAGIGAAVMLGHPSDSQLYFLEAVRPYLSIAAVCGVLAARRPPWTLVGGMAVLGIGAALAAEGLEFSGGALVRVVAPYLMLGVAALLVWRRGLVAAVVALLGGYAVPSSVREVVAHVTPEKGERERLIPDGALEAGRWLRDHSSPADVVATDLHCRYAWRVRCDSRHYWVAGFTERRVLVEGWAYAESTLSRAELFVTSYLKVPFADPVRLAANDAAFQYPSAENVRHLAQKYGVKWLFTGINPELGKFATLRFRNATSAVYQIR
ncbi:hypothetical protein SAMN05444920_113211 [Nonomuraea solani]|uniref:4-amino-4-deoxy-L-arabinose transferase n=1 Tax=Nonomuraea solani TaxID=1144553 RepID=A0A1H6ERN8_9ACTN|nr:hypothetical protein [Nonomuraea solani]SEG99615.1 hypothetical protein SAMN05444920_113211 [Nonomuraea solani]